MALRPALIDSFFPEVYDENWLFLFDQDQLLPWAREVIRYSDPGGGYDPIPRPSPGRS